MPRVAADGRPKIKDDRFASHRRPDRGDRRAADPWHHLQANFCHGHQGASIAGRKRNIGFVLLYGLNGEPHRRCSPTSTQRLTRLGVHPNRNPGMAQGGDPGKPRLGNEERLDLGGIAKKQKSHIWPPPQGAGGTWNDHFRSMVAAHSVERNSYWLGHGLGNFRPAG